MRMLGLGGCLCGQAVCPLASHRSASVLSSSVSEDDSHCSPAGSPALGVLVVNVFYKSL